MNTETAPSKMAKLILFIRFLRSKQPSGEGCHEMVFHFYYDRSLLGTPFFILHHECEHASIWSSRGK